MNGEAKQASLGCYRATFTLQYSLYCHAKEPLFHSYRVTIGAEERLFLYIMGSTLKQNHTETAFYSLYDICMARQMIKTTIETIETTGFA